MKSGYKELKTGYEEWNKVTKRVIKDESRFLRMKSYSKEWNQAIKNENWL